MGSEKGLGAGARSACAARGAADHNHSCGLSLFIDAFIGINTNVLKIDRIVLVGSI
jgi:hypothetical protein